MDPKLIEARDYVVKAREALRRGDKDIARDLGEKAVLLVPDLEDAWLVLVAAEANPEDALAYARKALELNPQSQRANKAVQWAGAQLDKVQAAHPLPAAEPVRDESAAAPVRRPAHKEAKQPAPAKTSNRRTWLLAGSVVGLLLCVALGIAAWSAIGNPAFAAFLPVQVQPLAATQEPLSANVDLPKPSVTPIDADAFAAQPTSISAATDTPVPTMPPTETPTLAPTATPSEIPTETPTATPEFTETPGVMGMEVIADTPTSVLPTAAPPAVVSGNGRGGARWIDVNLSTQTLYAYEGDTLVNSFVVSTGTWLTPTVVGKYKVWIKFASTSMSGPGYYLPDVPYVMYFYKGYGIHGTYWHNNFGTPMSHGCVNMRTSEAQWLFNWASVGTVVNVHY
jgi:lipoprotein-anchoring transpeptidase ErfK/SrfK